MSLRVIRDRELSATVVKVEGELIGSGTVELVKLCQGLAKSIVLDLQGLTTVDMEGLAVIRRLRARGIRLRGLAPDIDLSLQRGLPRRTRPRC